MLENGQVKIHCSNKLSEKIMVIIYLKKKKVTQSGPFLIHDLSFL